MNLKELHGTSSWRCRDCGKRTAISRSNSEVVNPSTLHTLIPQLSSQSRPRRCPFWIKSKTPQMMALQL